MNARGLSVGYGDQPVCAPTTFDLLPSQVLALVGVNGADKSTILRACYELLHPLSGQACILGHVSDPRSGARRTTLAMDLERGSFFPALIVAEHLRMVHFGHGVIEADERVSDPLEGLGLRQLMGHLSEELSPGQRRRPALTSVLVRPRRLLALDEPEQRLDRVTRLLLTDMLVEGREAGGGVLMVSHDPEVMEEAATDVLPAGHDTRMLSVDDGVHATEEGLR